MYCEIIKSTFYSFSYISGCLLERTVAREVLNILQFTGADPEISERGGRKPNSRKGGPEFDFSKQLSVIFL